MNWTSPKPFYGSTNNLDACVFDAQDMQAITKAYKFSSSILTNEHATTQNVKNDIVRASQSLREGDLFVITFSGHGASQDDTSGDESAANDPDLLDDPQGDNDNLDETWCLHDQMLLDDELYSLWKRFQPGVRILVILDSCHSGTAVRSVQESVSRALDYRSQTRDDSIVALDGAASEIGAFLLAGDSSNRRSMETKGVAFAPPAMAVRQRQKVCTLPRAYNFELMKKSREQNRELQRLIATEDKTAGRTRLQASVMLLAACQETQLAREEGLNGLFTRSIKLTLEEYLAQRQPQHFNGSYEVFLNRLKTRIGAPAQVPNLYRIGAEHAQFFRLQAPFVV